MKNEKASTISTALKQAIQTYHRQGFREVHIHGDRQFDHIKKFFSDAPINIIITRRNKHVPAIERHIQTVKERLCAIASQLPFEQYPNCLIVKMVYNVTFWLNYFLPTNEKQDTVILRTILSGLEIDHNKHC